MQWDDQFGVPSFLWAAPARTSVSAAAVRLSMSSEEAARSYLNDYAALYSLTPKDLANSYVANLHDTGNGAVVVKFRQKINGVAVFRDEMNVVIDRNQDLVALSGHLGGAPPPSAASFSTKRGKPVYFHLPDHYEPAYYYEQYEGENDETLYGYVVSAIDGRLLFRNAMTYDDATPAAFSYRVWAGADGDHLPFSGPQGYDGTPNPSASLDGYQPTFIAPNLITLPYGPISTKDPWLAPDAAETNGNNADAYADLFSPDGFSAGDLRASTTGLLQFDRTYDVTTAPGSSQKQQMAAIAQLFYDVNFLHDWYYDAGFNEAAGNAQNDNYGRGGLGGDSMKAEAQDFGGKNNANMSVPSDGGRPRMQMYVWDGIGNRYLRALSPGAIAKDYVTGSALFGPQAFDLTAQVVAATPADGCTQMPPTVAGKIAFIDRGGPAACTFASKVQNAKGAGAIGVIIGNVSSTVSPENITTMACSATPCPVSEGAYPPTLLIALTDANGFRANLANGITVTMHREAAVDRDGTIDNQIVAHEWMHYMSNRLVADANGLLNLQSRGMGEGWSDFNALLLTSRPEDTRFTSDATFSGVYATAVYATTGGSNGPLQNNGTYYGVRRVPYSTDMTKDPLTFKHVTNGVPLEGAPVRTGADGTSNSEVHNTGEVWCTMLWEAYASLLRDTLGPTPRLTFAEAQKRMREYLVASLKITPPTPTILEARDALLAAAFARDKTDYQEFWQAFAKRGAGINAVAPERYSTVNAGTVEDFNGSGGIAVTNVSIDDSVTSCMTDGILDGGEKGAIHVTLKNIGGIRLESTTISAGSTDASLSFGDVTSLPVSATNPGEAVTAVIPASLAQRNGSIATPDITLTIKDPQIPGSVQTVYSPRLNSYETPHNSATDDVEASTTAWTVKTNGAQKWTRLAVSARDHRWFAPEPYEATDMSLVSPPLVVAPAGNFSLTFKHRFAFDWVQSTSLLYIDGGVIELSTDDGATWTDIGSAIDPATAHYGTVSIFAGNGSVIERRLAFEGASAGFNATLPSTSPFTTTTVNLGSSFGGKRVRIRFRMVTGGDHSTTARLGWEIDDIAFTNILNLPFSTVSPDQGLCTSNPTTTVLTTTSGEVLAGQPVVLTANVTSQSSPNGTVDFFDNNTILATVRVANGKAQFGVNLPVGLHAITASFNGDKYYRPSASAAVTVQVDSTSRHRSVRH